MIAKLLFPIMLVFVVVLGGVGADFLRNKDAHGPHEEVEAGKGDKNSKDKKVDSHGKKKKDKKKDSHGKASDDEDGEGGGSDGSAVSFLNFKRQFVIPVVKQGKITSLVLLNLNLELNEDAAQDVFLLEPKLRDILMRKLLALSNKGLFSGDLTDLDTYEELQSSLTEAAGNVIHEGLEGVLILDLTRQDQ